MTDWTTVDITEESGSALALDLPPGWWHLRPDAGDTDDDIAAIMADAVADLPPDAPLGPELLAELGRFARVAAVSGAVLLAGGTAVDPAAGPAYALVVASLTVMPHDVYLTMSHAGQEDQGSRRMTVPAGAVLRRGWLGPVASPAGPLLQCEVDYVIAPPVPPSWVLSFQTPALHHLDALIHVFDGIAATLRIGHGAAVDIAAAFG